MVTTRLRDLALARGLSLQQVAEMADLPLETVRNIYYGKTPDPKVSTVMKLAKSFGMSVNCFMGQCEHTLHERALIQHYRTCGHHGKSIIELVAKYEALTAKGEREAKEKHAIPCLVPQGDIRAGIVYDTCQTKEIETTVPAAYIAIKMTTNHLAPVYCKDDVILIENRFPDAGECAVFLKGDRVYIRQYLEEAGQYRLRCLHNQGQDIVLRRMDEIEYMGTCIGAVRA